MVTAVLPQAHSAYDFSHNRSQSLTRNDFTSQKVEKRRLTKGVLELRDYKKQFTKYSKEKKRLKRLKVELEKEKTELDRMKEEAIVKDELEEVERRNANHVTKIEQEKEDMIKRKAFLAKEEERMEKKRNEFRLEYDRLIQYKTMFAEKLERLETHWTSQQLRKEEQERSVRALAEQESNKLETEKEGLLKIALSLAAEKERADTDKAVFEEQRAALLTSGGLNQEVSKLQAERDQMEAQKKFLESRNIELEERNTKLQSELSTLQRETLRGDAPRYAAPASNEVAAMGREIKGLRRQMDSMKAMYEIKIENLERQRESELANFQAEPDRTRNKLRKPGRAPNPRLSQMSKTLRDNISDFEHKREIIRKEMNELGVKKKENELLEIWLRTYEKELNEEYVKRRHHKLTNFEIAKIKYDMEKTRKKLEKREQIVSNRELELLSKKVVLEDIAGELCDVEDQLEAYKNNFSLAKALLEKENIFWDNLELYVEDQKPDSG